MYLTVYENVKLYASFFMSQKMLIISRIYLYTITKAKVFPLNNTMNMSENRAEEDT